MIFDCQTREETEASCDGFCEALARNTDGVSNSNHATKSRGFVGRNLFGEYSSVTKENKVSRLQDAFRSSQSIVFKQPVRV